MQPTVGVLVSALRYRWCHRSFEETTAWPTAADRYRYTSPKGRELRAAVLDGVLLRLGRAGSKALGPRRASSLAGLGARGARAFSVTVSARNHSLQATQSRRVVRLAYRWRLVALLGVATGLRAA